MRDREQSRRTLHQKHRHLTLDQSFLKHVPQNTNDVNVCVMNRQRWGGWWEGKDRCLKILENLYIESPFEESICTLAY